MPFQIRDVVSDIPAEAMKTGMLATAEVITEIANTLRSVYSSTSGTTLPPLVIDPVTISTSGQCRSLVSERLMYDILAIQNRASDQEATSSSAY